MHNDPLSPKPHHLFASASPKKQPESSHQYFSGDGYMDRRKSSQVNENGALSHLQTKMDVKNMKAHFLQRFGENYDSIINAEILSAINNLKGSGQPSKTQKSSFKGAQRLSVEDIEKRINQRINRKQPFTTKNKDQGLSGFRVQRSPSPIKIRQAANEEVSAMNANHTIDDQMKFLQNQDIGIGLSKLDQYSAFPSLKQKLDSKQPTKTRKSRNVFENSSKMNQSQNRAATHAQSKEQLELIEQQNNKHRNDHSAKSPSQVSPKLNKILAQNMNYTSTQAAIKNRNLKLNQYDKQRGKQCASQFDGGMDESRRYKQKEPSQFKIEKARKIEGTTQSIPATPMANINDFQGHMGSGSITERDHSAESGTQYLKGIINSIISKPTATQNLFEGQLSQKLKKDIKADIHEFNDKTNKTSATLRSSLLPFSFNISPSKQHYNDSGSHLGTRDLGVHVHQPLKESVAKGIYQSFAPLQGMQRRNQNSIDSERRSIEDTSRQQNEMSPIFRNKKAKKLNIDKQIYVREENSQSGSNINQRSPRQNSSAKHNDSVWKAVDKMNRSIHNDTSSGHYPQDSQLSEVTERSAHYFDLNNTVSGTAVGGPIRPGKITMWDMMTLYDTQKKKIEDEEKFVQFKQQQKQLKDFYQTQMEFKNQVKAIEDKQKQLDLDQLQINQKTLSAYEKDFERKKRSFMNKLSSENKKNVVAHRRMQTVQLQDHENSVKKRYHVGENSLEKALRLRDDEKIHKKQNLLSSQRDEIEIKKQRLRQIKEVDMQRSKQDLEYRDQECAIRDQQIAEHHKKIAERDHAIFQVYNSPQQVTHTKFEMEKNHRVNKLNEALLQKSIERTRQQGEEKLQKKLNLLKDMIHTNTLTRIHQAQQLATRKAHYEKERKMVGTLGRVNQYTAHQIAELNDIKRKKAVHQLQAKRHLLDLEKQIQDKKLREENQRLYLDEKQMATSGSIMKQINPQLFHAQAGSTEKLIEDKHYLEHECKKMNDIKFGQYFLPTQLRGQRFKD